MYVYIYIYIYIHVYIHTYIYIHICSVTELSDMRFYPMRQALPFTRLTYVRSSQVFIKVCDCREHSCVSTCMHTSHSCTVYEDAHVCS